MEITSTGLLGARMSALRKRAILPIVLVAACLLAMVVVITQTYTVASRDNIHAIVKSNEAPRRTLPKPTIALLMPARSTTSMVAVENAPLLTTFLPSMIETISSDDRNNFDYALYMGFDVADPLFDNEKNLKTLKQKVENANVFKIIEFFAFHKTKVYQAREMALLLMSMSGASRACLESFGICGVQRRMPLLLSS